MKGNFHVRFLENRGINLSRLLDTLLIKDILEESQPVLLFPRPRRFGKTLNLSMLQVFFEKTDISNEHLFTDKAIWDYQQYREIQGSFPVIFISLKNARADNWETMYRRATKIIADEYRRHSYLLTSNNLDTSEKNFCSTIIERNAPLADFIDSLSELARLLHKYHGKEVMLLIDEYDVPFQEAYVFGFYKEASSFFGNFLASALKGTTDYVEKAVLTGILMPAKEGIFTGLNNFVPSTLLRP